MHQMYSPEEKASALDLLEEKKGDVSYVSYLTGISERTLYTWKKHLKYMQMEGERETPAPLHWVRQHPERIERLQQQREKRLQQQQRGVQSLRAADTRHEMTTFGMTHEELEEALKVEYIPSPYTNLHADLMLHLQHLNFSLTDEPEMAHRKALAFSRIFAVVQQLEEMVRVEKPQVSVIKYEYPDGSYHDIPPWSNAVHERASLAYDAVVAEARRQYEEQKNAPVQPIEQPSDIEEETQASATDSPDSPAAISPELPLSDMEELRQQATLTLDEILAIPFEPDDFVPKHTGILKYFLGEDPYAHHKQSNPDSDSDTPPDP